MNWVHCIKPNNILSPSNPINTEHTYCSYQPTRTSDCCILIGNSPNAPTACVRATSATRSWSSVLSEGSIDKMILASLLTWLWINSILVTIFAVTFPYHYVFMCCIRQTHWCIPEVTQFPVMFDNYMGLKCSGKRLEANSTGLVSFELD